MRSEVSAAEVLLQSPLLRGLNPEQAAAVTLPSEPALILAGAGSGKTRVLTTRIAWLLSTGQVTPGGLMAVTFTNKAAKEMTTRLTAMLPVNVRGMWIGTFHGLCNRFLRAHHKLANLPATFQILDTQDQLSAVKRVMKANSVDEERFPPKEMQWFISGNKEDGLRPAEVEARTSDERRKVEIYQLYENQCQREGVVDFSELMLRSYELMRDNEALRAHYRRRFRHILIDEFQDTNRLQYAWIKAFAGLPGEAQAQGEGGGESSAVFAVGDDDQSIYAFRGARVGNMADFVREFQVQHQIKLEENYRSYSNILDSANELISHNKTRLGKNLRTTQGPGEPVRVYEAPTDQAEAQWLVEEMRHLMRGEGIEDGVPRKEMAVLYRSNAQSRVIETALFNAGVPYRVYGGLRFFERAEIKHALAYLRLLENANDDNSFLRVVNFPPRGIGSRSVEQLQDAARKAGTSLHSAVALVTGAAGAKLAGFIAKIDVLREQTRGQSLRQIVELALQHSGLVEHYRAERDGQDRVENLEELASAAESFVTQEGFGKDAVALPIDELRGDSARAQALRQSPVSQGIDPNAPMLNESLKSPSPQPSPTSGSGSDSPPLPQSRESGSDLPPLPQAGEGGSDLPPLPQAGESGSDLPPLPQVREGGSDAPPLPQAGEGGGEGAPNSDTGETLSPLAAFLTHAALESGDNQAQAGQDAVQLMTVHAAKGLEFDCVFASGLEEGLFPSERSLADRDGLEEERRLMYVAITRARKRLYLSFSQTRLLHGQTRYNLKSRFFDELPEAALKWLTPKNQGYGGGSAFGYGMGYPSTRTGQSGQGSGGAGYTNYPRELAPTHFASPPVPVQKAPPSHGLRSGMQVFHAKFGEGTVLMLEGGGPDARAQINFPRHGIKWLALSVAKLTPVP